MGLKKIKTLKLKCDITERIKEIYEALPETQKSDFDNMGSMMSYKERGYSLRYERAILNPSLITLESFIEHIIDKCVEGYKNDIKRLKNTWYNAVKWYINTYFHYSVEYHHYGKNADIEYFLNKDNINKIFIDSKYKKSFVDIINEYYTEKEIDVVKMYYQSFIKKQKTEFLKNKGTYIHRTLNKTDNMIVTEYEMHGKYGWFEADTKYNLPIYYSGYVLNDEDLNEYKKLFGDYY